MLVDSEYPITELHPMALVWDRTSFLTSCHHASRVSGSSEWGDNINDYIQVSQACLRVVVTSVIEVPLARLRGVVTSLYTV